MKNKVDFDALKRSKKAKNKIQPGDILLKSNCPVTDNKCKNECSEDNCKKQTL